MKILVVTRSEWSDSNSVGNTMSNFFGGYKKSDIAALSFRSANPRNSVCERYFQLSEMQFYRGGRPFNSNKVEKNQEPDHSSRNEKSVLNKLESFLVRFFRESSFSLPYILQDLFWRINWWQSTSLTFFLQDFQPDVIFLPSTEAPYVHRVTRYISSKFNIPIVLFHTDDYLCKRDKLNSWLARLLAEMRRSAILKTVKLAKLNFVISDFMLNHYQNNLHIKCLPLVKGVKPLDPLFVDKILTGKCLRRKPGSVIQIVYIGFLGYSRWKTLRLLIDSISKIQSPIFGFSLSIYSQFVPSSDVLLAIEKTGVSKFMGSLDSNKVAEALSSADLILHVESFDDVEIDKVRFSFSTKIIDCLASFTPLLAIGPENVASIDYLSRSGVTYCVTDPNILVEQLKCIENDYAIGRCLGEDAYKYVCNNHDIQLNRKYIIDSIESVC